MKTLEATIQFDLISPEVEKQVRFHLQRAMADFYQAHPDLVHAWEITETKTFERFKKIGKKNG